MHSQSQINREEQGNVLAPFLKAAQAIAALDHHSVEASRLRRDANKLIDLLLAAPAIALCDLPELEQARLELVECSFESVADWIDVAKSVESISASSGYFKSARVALKQSQRLLGNLIDC
jgi:hypothetical protein